MLASYHEQDTAFVAHRGLHQFRVMPFGLVKAPATFNRLMRKLLFGNESVDNYVDVLAHTINWHNRMNALRDFFRRLRDAHLTLRSSKCRIGFSSVPYLSHKMIGNRKLETKTEMLRKSLEAPRPMNKEQLRAVTLIFGIGWLLQEAHPQLCSTFGTSYRFDSERYSRKFNIG